MLPSDLLFIIHEEAVIQDEDKCIDGKELPVVPVTWDQLSRTISNPFKGPNKRRVLRLDSNGTSIQVYSQYNIGSYIMRYLMKPSPIILVDLEELSIDNENKKTECKLDSIIHDMILQRAVQLAFVSRGYMDKR